MNIHGEEEDEEEGKERGHNASNRTEQVTHKKSWIGSEGKLGWRNQQMFKNCKQL